MTDDESRPRRGGCRTSATKSLSTVPDFERGFIAGWADRAIYARRTSLTFDDGVEFGWAMASRAMNNAIAEACQGIPAGAAEIIRRLILRWDDP